MALGLLLIPLAAAAAPADAMGGWHLTQRTRSCLIEAVSDRGTYLKIEGDAVRRVYFMSVSSLHWQNVQDRQSYRLGFAMAGHPPRQFIATGARDDGSPRTIVVFQLPDGPAGHTLQELRYSETVTLDLDGGQPLQIDTRGLQVALARLRECVDTQAHRINAIH